MTLERFPDAIKVLGTDGTLWDVVPGELEWDEDDPVVPFRGRLFPDAGASITGWSGPVKLVLPDGRTLDAYITPGGKAGNKRVIRVVGT